MSAMLEAQKTADANLADRGTFLHVYYEPIRLAVAALPFVREGDVGDIVHRFILDVDQRTLDRCRERLMAGEIRSFRGWLFRSLRNHAVDYYRRPQGGTGGVGLPDPDGHGSGGDDVDPTEDEHLYALAMLHLAVRRVRRHWQEHARPEAWESFETVFLRSLFPRPGGADADHGPRRLPQRVYDQASSVLRVFRRILPEVIPAELCNRRDPKERYEEWSAILVRSRAAAKLPIWLAFLKDPHPAPDLTGARSEDLAVGPDPGGNPSPRTEDERERSEAEAEELRVLLAFWLAMPFRDYLEGIDPRVPGTSEAAPSLLTMLDGPTPEGDKVERLRQVRGFTKRVFQWLKETGAAEPGPDAPRRAHSMPPEVVQVLYNLTAALGLTRCGVRIDTLPLETIRLNFAWALARPWLARDLRPVFAEALRRLDGSSAYGDPRAPG